MQRLDEQIAQMQQLKIEVMQGAKQDLPMDVGLIYLPHTRKDDNFAKGDWGDANKERAWVRCKSCSTLIISPIGLQTNAAASISRPTTSAPSVEGGLLLWSRDVVQLQWWSELDCGGEYLRGLELEGHGATGNFAKASVSSSFPRCKKCQKFMEGSICSFVCVIPVVLS